jgi:hypothetical protein
MVFMSSAGAVFDVMRSAPPILRASWRLLVTALMQARGAAALLLALQLTAIARAPLLAALLLRAPVADAAPVCMRYCARVCGVTYPP